jgi:hypothetical protein
MRKLLTATAVCGLAVGLVVAPDAVAKKRTKLVYGTVSVFVTPNPVPASATTVTASGNVAANSSCRNDRTVPFTYVNALTGAATSLPQTAVTGSNGDYSVVLPRSTATLPSTAVLQARVDQQFRRVGSSKKKGKKARGGGSSTALRSSGRAAR